MNSVKSILAQTSDIKNFPFPNNESPEPPKVNKVEPVTNIAQEAPNVVFRKARVGRPRNVEIHAKQARYQAAKQKDAIPHPLQITTNSYVVPESPIQPAPTVPTVPTVPTATARIESLISSSQQADKQTELLNLIQTQSLKIDLIAQGMADMGRALNATAEYLLKNPR